MLLGSEARDRLAAAVVAGVSAQYSQLAEDTLSTVRKTESSLKRLKSRKEGVEAGGGWHKVVGCLLHARDVFIFCYRHHWSRGEIFGPCHACRCWC
jgi:hypothetical protein